ncbi:hypothetical protein AVEN_86827-1 [Araneus ventricosus]|uniref:Uncharacterized protein n=1 Tax=Araneus ventricosus TaxID=182803 RepID=A0A4Y2D1W3_ARAVE|nr:hypothetical protein AVEN_86827-1 [Araneus ventricosus]
MCPYGPFERHMYPYGRLNVICSHMIPLSVICAHMVPLNVICAHMIPLNVICAHMVPLNVICAHMVPLNVICGHMIPLNVICAHMITLKIRKPFTNCSNRRHKVTIMFPKVFYLSDNNVSSLYKIVSHPFRNHST